MYIEYERDQCTLKHTDGTLSECKFERLSPNPTNVPEYKPSKLVRVSDMKLVRGSDVEGEYWALSYSSNQTGEKFNPDGPRLDQGKHKIINYWKDDERTRFARNNYGSGEVIVVEPVTKSVKFKRLIQEICNDFGIRYIWYDKMCPSQANQKHLIYENARCTLVLVPELRSYSIMQRPVLEELFSGQGRDDKLLGGKADVHDVNVEVLPRTQWSKRMDTLDEAYLSKDLLFVGRNIHFYSQKVDLFGSSDARSDSFLEHLKYNSKWRVCTALWYARTRIGSRAGDRIPAFANIFPELRDKIKACSRQPTTQESMIKLYGLLAKSDYSVLAFGAICDSDDDDDEETSKVRQEEASRLPSWIGLNGVHILQNLIKSEQTNGSFGYSIKQGCMSLVSQFILARIETATSVEKPAEPDGDEYKLTNAGLPADYIYQKGRLSVRRTENLIFIGATRDSKYEYDAYLKNYGLKATHGMPVKMEQKEVVNTLSRPTHIGGFLSLAEDASECIILTGVKFETHYHGVKKSMLIGHFFHPVIKKEDNHYRSIGICLFDGQLNFESVTIQPEQTFVIQ